MANDVDMTGWSELLHTSTKLLEQASPSTHFTPLQRSLDQLETLSTKLKAKTLRAEAPSQSISATRLLAREGINAEQLARDLKSFELKTTFEDVFPSEAATLEEYLQQLHEMAIVSSIQEAQKDNLRSFNDHMMRVLEDDWNKEKRDFLQSLSRLSTLPRRSSSLGGTGFSRPAVMSPQVSTPQLSTGASAMAIVPASDKTVTEKKASAYAEIVRHLNEVRSCRLPFKLATALRAAYEGLGADSSGGKSVNMQKIWHLIQALVGEDMTTPRSTSRRMSLVIGARRHLEWGHEKYIMDTIQSHATVATLGGSVGNIQKIQAFLRVRLRDHGVLDFDATDMRRQPPVDTTWQQIYYCLRTGYYDEAKKVAQSSRAAHQFAPQLTEWIVSGGNVSSETAISASEECEKMLRMTDRAGRPSYDRKKLILYAIVSGSRRHIERMLRDLPNLFTTIEDFLWFKLSAVRDPPSSASSSLFSTEGLVPYTLEDLQSYLNKFEPAYYTKNGRDPLVYPYVLLLSVQSLPAILYLSKEGEEGVSIDAVHIAICLADRGVLEGFGSGQKAGVLMDACAEVAGVIRQYGSVYLRNGNLELALEYYVQAASAIGGGEASWIGNGTVEQQRQRNIMLRQLLTEILLREGGIDLLLGLRGTGEEGELSKYMTDLRARQQFLVEAARHCQESGLYDKSVEIHKRVGAFGMALETINKCLSDAICAMARGRLDSNSQATSLVRSSDDVLEASRNYPQTSEQDKELLIEQQTVLRQLESILSILTLARAGHHVEALREIVNIKFLPLDPRSPNVSSDVVRNLNPHVQACVPDLLRGALTCLDNVGDADGTLRALKSKIASIVANNMSMNWPQDLYEKVARSI
ncbi:Nuclear pore complex protein Nup93 [Rhynchospora pubera]|uniref:Nuclear pore protein n=1 Tax=Rhynchospora pubera TaxID=906938 RepID=A0AAV8H1L1_9POAL|nr:Nuclear pore complex protein Nup93 [Rhynchospora pubera]